MSIAAITGSQIKPVREGVEAILTNVKEMKKQQESVIRRLEAIESKLEKIVEKIGV